jgi:hypothetical protein
MDYTDSKSVGGHVESADCVLASHFAAVMQVQTSAVGAEEGHVYYNSTQYRVADY